MKYLIIGAGGTGGAIGGFLARAGKDVTFIDKGVHLEKIKTSGLYLETPNGEYMISAPAYSTSEYSDVPDVIFVCVKGYSLRFYPNPPSPTYTAFPSAPCLAPAPTPVS